MASVFNFKLFVHVIVLFSLFSALVSGFRQIVAAEVINVMAVVYRVPYAAHCAHGSRCL